MNALNVESCSRCIYINPTCYMCGELRDKNASRHITNHDEYRDELTDYEYMSR